MGGPESPPKPPEDLPGGTPEDLPGGTPEDQALGVSRISESSERRILEGFVAEQKKGWFDVVKSSYVWKSMFRHEYQDTYRNRVLQVSSNVFLHLHPTKIRRHALRLRFTWCMGGITFLLFLILTVTGIILMFYYRPTGEYAYHDMKYLQFDVPF